MTGKKKITDAKPQVPSYIVTFSDMITLLLTFFVMLLSMAEKQIEDHKFEVGINSFKRAITDLGISGLLSSRSASTLDHPKSYHRVDAGMDEPEDRSIDARTEMLRRILMEVEEIMTISPSHITGIQKTPFTTNIRFPEDGWELTTQAKQTLDNLVEQFKISYSHLEPTVYVLAMASDAPPARQFSVSARRSETVTTYIRRQLGTEDPWPVYGWGAGAGGAWAGHGGLITGQTQILIMLLTEGH